MGRDPRRTHRVASRSNTCSSPSKSVVLIWSNAAFAHHIRENQAGHNYFVVNNFEQVARRYGAVRLRQTVSERSVIQIRQMQAEGTQHVFGIAAAEVINQ